MAKRCETLGVDAGALGAFHTASEALGGVAAGALGGVAAGDALKAAVHAAAPLVNPCLTGVLGDGAAIRADLAQAIKDLNASIEARSTEANAIRDRLQDGLG